MNFITYIVRGSFPFFEQLFVKRRRLVLFVLMPLVSLLFHIAIFGTDLVGIHVWRQTQTMGTITNFYEAFGRWDFNIFTPHINDYGISQDGRGLYCMEFPLMQYIVAWFYFILRVPITEVWLVRVLMFGVGLGTVFGIEALMRHIFRIDRSLPLVAAWMLLFSPVFYYYMLNPMPDNVALGFSIWGLAIFFKVYEYDHQSTSTELRRYLECLLGSLLLALAALVKLPYVLFTVPVVILIIDDFLYQYAARWRSVAVLLMLFGCLVSPAWWYMSVVGHWQGNGVVLGILDSRLTAWQWLDIFAFHWYSTQFELLLNYAATPFYLFGIASLFIPVLRRRLFAYYRGEAIAVIGLAVAWISYLAFEANMIGRTHDYYLMPFLPHLLIVATMGYIALKWFLPPLKTKTLSMPSVLGQSYSLLLSLLPPTSAYSSVGTPTTPIR